MNNQVAAPCCGSCLFAQCCATGLRCFKTTSNELVSLGQITCLHGEGYKPRVFIPIIDVPGVKELVEAACRASSGSVNI